MANLEKIKTPPLPRSLKGSATSKKNGGEKSDISFSSVDEVMIASNKRHETTMSNLLKTNPLWEAGFGKPTPKQAAPPAQPDAPALTATTLSETELLSLSDELNKSYGDKILSRMKQAKDDVALSLTILKPPSSHGSPVPLQVLIPYGLEEVRELDERQEASASISDTEEGEICTSMLTVQQEEYNTNTVPIDLAMQSMNNGPGSVGISSVETAASTVPASVGMPSEETAVNTPLVEVPACPANVRVNDPEKGKKASTPWASLLKGEVASRGSTKLTYNPPTLVNGKMVVKSSANKYQRHIKSCEGYLIGHFLGRKPHYDYVKQQLTRLWKIEGEFTMLSHGDRFFLFKFTNDEDREKVKNIGPLHVGNIFFVIRQWRPFIELEPIEQSIVPVWVNIRKIPLHLWNKDGLSDIASSIGIPIVADEITEDKMRLNYARVLVEVTPSNLPPFATLVLDDEEPLYFPVEYPWKPTVCKLCGLFGHAQGQCPNSKTPNTPKLPQRMVPTQLEKGKQVNNHEWQHVSNRRNKKHQRQAHTLTDQGLNLNVSHQLKGASSYTVPIPTCGTDTTLVNATSHPPHISLVPISPTTICNTAPIHPANPLCHQPIPSSLGTNSGTVSPFASVPVAHCATVTPLMTSTLALSKEPSAPLGSSALYGSSCTPTLAVHSMVASSEQPSSSALQHFGSRQSLSSTLQQSNSSPLEQLTKESPLPLTASGYSFDHSCNGHYTKGSVTNGNSAGSVAIESSGNISGRDSSLREYFNTRSETPSALSIPSIAHLNGQYEGLGKFKEVHQLTPQAKVVSQVTMTAAAVASNGFTDQGGPSSGHHTIAGLRSSINPSTNPTYREDIPEQHQDSVSAYEQLNSHHLLKGTVGILSNTGIRASPTDLNSMNKKSSKRVGKKADADMLNSHHLLQGEIL